MQPINLDDDVRSVSEVRQHGSQFVQQVRATRRPLVLTENGTPAAVLLDVREYERLVEQTELMDALRDAERQLDAGLGIPHEHAIAELRTRFQGR